MSLHCSYSLSPPASKFGHSMEPNTLGYNSLALNSQELDSHALHHVHVSCPVNPSIPLASLSSLDTSSVCSPNFPGHLEGGPESAFTSPILTRHSVSIGATALSLYIVTDDCLPCACCCLWDSELLLGPHLCARAQSRFSRRGEVSVFVKLDTTLRILTDLHFIFCSVLRSLIKDLLVNLPTSRH